MPAKGRELKRIAETTSDITLKLFLEASGLELVDVYAGNHSWSDLLEAGGVLTLPSGPEELTLRRALGRLLHLDDSQRINQYRSFAQATQPPSIGAMDLRTRRLFHMLATVLTESVNTKDVSLDVAASIDRKSTRLNSSH